MRNAYRIPGLFISVILFAMCIAGCTSVTREYYPDGTLRSEIPVKGNQYHGTAVFYYSDGAIQMESDYVRGKLNGQTIRYYSNGQKKEWLFYTGDKPDSLYISWDPMGNMLLECHYRDSLLHGSYTEYYQNGQVKTSGAYVNGLFDGKWWYYDQYGIIIGTGQFSAGTGVQQAYHSNGRLRQIIRYENGLKQGTEQLFSPMGELLEENIYTKGILMERNIEKR